MLMATASAGPISRGVLQDHHRRVVVIYRDPFHFQLNQVQIASPTAAGADHATCAASEGTSPRRLLSA